MSKKNVSKQPIAPKGVQNRRASFDFELIERYEAGIALVGSEVKSLYLGQGNLTDAYCAIRNGELFLINLEIAPYAHSSAFTPDRRRDRKLLMHKREILTLQRKAQEKGLTLVPTKLYFKEGRVKVEVAIGRGRKEYDKRHQIADKEERREKERVRAKDYRD